MEYILLSKFLQNYKYRLMDRVKNGDGRVSLKFEADLFIVFN